MLNLRDITIDDCPQLLECGCDDKAQKYYDPSVFADLASLETYTRDYFIPLREKTGLPAQIIEIDGQLGGFIYFCYAKEERGRRITELAFVIHQRFRRKGYGTCVLRKMIQLGFEELAYDEIMLSCYPANSGSIRLAQKLGMAPLESWWSDGKEILQYGISKEDFSGVE